MRLLQPMINRLLFLFCRSIHVSLKRFVDFHVHPGLPLKHDDFIATLLLVLNFVIAGKLFKKFG